ncbi:MAG: RagB/SusD family nutrient uptake outer membrane protein [Bacteroidota bacterium]
MNTFSKLYGTLLLVALFLTGCFNALNVAPLDPDEVTSAVVYENPDSYKQVLGKLYASLAVTGQQGPAGQGDISGLDEGFSSYLRLFWKLQELPTDEAVIGWNDGTIQNLSGQGWDASSEFVAAMYSRIFYTIAVANELLRESTDAKLDERGVDAGLRAEIATFRAEARMVRALSYYHALDMFRSVPFVTEEDAVGSFFPNQISAAELFEFIETELKDIETLLAEPGSNEYGRVDKAAAWTLLARLYLNAEVYIGQNRASDCITYCSNVINSGYSLEPIYKNVFAADNDNAEGIIFPVTFDGKRTQTFGGTTFLVHASVGGSMSTAEAGIDFGWGGIRTTSALVDKFPALGGSELVSPNQGATYTDLLTVAGSFQAWTPESSSGTNIISVAGDNTYEAYFNFPDANTEFKLTDGTGWATNWGSTANPGEIAENGGNIAVADPGFYRLQVDLTNLTYTLTNTQWGLIGDATPGGWDNDTDMTYNAADNAWEITVELTAGEVKFRANDDWALNYGDTGSDAILEEGGDNIAIPSAGLYTIKLYLDQPDHTYSIEQPKFDTRALFFTEGQNLEITDISQFTEGYAITKWRNITSTGAPGSDLTFVDNDFPVFRLADAYLMYAEAVLRGGTGGDLGTALGYVNQVRERAFGNTAGNITESELTLDFILDERAREFYWEGHRRTDLVRFGSLSNTTYLWPWKGGTAEGVSTDSKFDIFPIPSADLGANSNLTQNPGY